MNTIQLFTDGSVDVKTGIGYGACLIVIGTICSQEELKKQLHVKRFENTSSTRLELETLIWALSNLHAGKNKIEIYTDSQNIMSLHGRRNRFEQKAYRSNNNKLLKNHDLYKEFFKVTETLNFELIKVEGHQPSRYKDNIHRLFTLVDKASRNALRKEINSWPSANQ